MTQDCLRLWCPVHPDGATDHGVAVESGDSMCEPCSLTSVLPPSRSCKVLVLVLRPFHWGIALRVEVDSRDDAKPVK